MAEQSEIDAVKEMLGPEAVAAGWNDEKVGALLDAGETPPEIALAYWEARAAQTSSLVNVTESGSSRSLSDIHKQALNMAQYYGKKIAEDEEEEETATRSGRRSVHLRRA